MSIRDLDNISFADWFRSHGGSDGSIKRMWNNCLCARFIDCENISARCMLTIFQLFAARTRHFLVLEGSPYEYLHKPILEYLEAHGAKSILATECVQFYY